MEEVFRQVSQRTDGLLLICVKKVVTSLLELLSHFWQITDNIKLSNVEKKAVTSLLDLPSHIFWQLTDGLLLSGVDKAARSLTEEAAEEIQQKTIGILKASSKHKHNLSKVKVLHYQTCSHISITYHDVGDNKYICNAGEIVQKCIVQTQWFPTFS